MFDGKGYGGLLLQVFKAEQGDIEEVPGAASRIENLDGSEFYQELVQDAVGFVARFAQLRGG